MALPGGANAQGRLPNPVPGEYGHGRGATATPLEVAMARGDQALERGDIAVARREFETAARIDPRDARPVFYLGEVAMREEQWPAAEGHFRDAIRLDARMAEAYAELGAVLRERGRNGDAIAPLETAVRLAPQLPEAHFTLALALEDAGQTERALGEYRAAVRLAPAAPMPALDLGILLANGHPPAGSPARAEALRALQSAVRNAHDDRAVLAGAGPALRVLGEPALAAQVLERARAHGAPSAALLAELAQALWAVNDRGQALRRIAEAIRIEPRAPELRYVHALMQAGQGDRRGAEAELREVERLASGSPLARKAAERIAELGRSSQGR